MNNNYYDVLGIENSSSIDDIKEAYKQQIKILHPDRNGNKINKYFINVLNEAYKVLSDPVQRKSYDSSLNNKKKVHNNTNMLMNWSLFDDAILDDSIYNEYTSSLVINDNNIINKLLQE